MRIDLFIQIGLGLLQSGKCVYCNLLLSQKKKRKIDAFLSPETLLVFDPVDGCGFAVLDQANFGFSETLLFGL